MRFIEILRFLLDEELQAITAVGVAMVECFNFQRSLLVQTSSQRRVRWVGPSVGSNAGRYLLRGHGWMWHDDNDLYMQMHDID